MKKTKDLNKQVKAELRREADEQNRLYDQILNAHSELKNAREKCVTELRSATSAQETLNKVQASKATSPPNSNIMEDAELRDAARSDQDFGAKLKELREANNKRA